MEKSELLGLLSKVGACSGAREIVEGLEGDAEAIWNSYPRGGHMLWIAAKLVNRKVLVFAACQCARLVLHLVQEGEDRPRIAIETAEAWTRGEATLEQVRTAAADAADAYAAAYAAYVAADAADAAYAAADAADAADAAHAAYAAADAAYAAAAAAAAYAAAAAADAARQHTCLKCADAVRTHIPYSLLIEGVERLGE